MSEASRGVSRRGFDVPLSGLPPVDGNSVVVSSVAQFLCDASFFLAFI